MFHSSLEIHVMFVVDMSARFTTRDPHSTANGLFERILLSKLTNEAGSK